MFPGSLLFRPHRMHRIDAVCCYIRRTFHERSTVCLCVRHTGEPCKTAEPIKMAFGTESCRPQNRVFDGGQDPPREGEFGEGGVFDHCNARYVDRIYCRDWWQIYSGDGVAKLLWILVFLQTLVTEFFVNIDADVSVVCSSACCVRRRRLAAGRREGVWSVRRAESSRRVLLRDFEWSFRRAAWHHRRRSRVDWSPRSVSDVRRSCAKVRRSSVALSRWRPRRSHFAGTYYCQTSLSGYRLRE